ncbi:MAG: hypothetical protein ABSA63_03110 [Thermoplasmata archaeon]
MALRADLLPSAADADIVMVLRGCSGTAMEDRAELDQIVFGQTRVILTRDLSTMNPNLVGGSQGLVIGKLAPYTLKVAFPKVTVGVNWKDCDIVPGKTGMPNDADQPKVVPKPRHMGEE